MPGIEEETGVTIVFISPWVYHCVYVYIAVSGCVCVCSGARNPAMKSHMFVQSEQGGDEYCWIRYRLIKVWMVKWWRVWCHWKHCANFCV